MELISKAPKAILRAETSLESVIRLRPASTRAGEGVGSLALPSFATHHFAWSETANARSAETTGR